MKISHMLFALTSAFALWSCQMSPGSQVDDRNYVVEGAADHIGGFPWTEGLTLRDAVMLAHPMEERCDLSRVELLREDAGESLRITVDVSEMTETGDTTFNVLVLEGDVIKIPYRTDAR